MLKIRKTIISKPVPIIKLIPNFVTLLGLVIGMSSVKFALDSKWEIAVYCIIIAAIIDGIDGRIARMLNATSPFGAELDSLCDFANFGIAPAYLIYLWSFQQYEYKVFSSAVMLLFIVCMALRLARFNVGIYQPKQDEKPEHFFTGVPAPCGALLALVPVMVDFEIGTLLNINVRIHTITINTYLAIVALLLASRLPTISTKNLSIKPEYLSLAMILFAVVIINLIIYPWYALPLSAVIYILSIPFCYFLKHKFNNN